MSDKPTVIQVIGSWRFQRWQYNGAPLEAVHVHSDRGRVVEDFTVEIDAYGDLVFSGLDYEGFDPSIPAWVLLHLVDDAKARQVGDWT